MNNNDILRRLRYTFDFNDVAMIKLFQEGGQIVSRKQLLGWLKKEDDPTQIKLPDVNLAGALNGLIILKRGKQDGPQPVPETRLTNNLIFRKLKIALELRDDDILPMLASENIKLSKHELSAFFRKPDHKHYRECKDQVLRNFLFALQKKYRGDQRATGNKKTARPKSKSRSEPKKSPGSVEKKFEWKVPKKK